MDFQRIYELPDGFAAVLGDPIFDDERLDTFEFQVLDEDGLVVQETSRQAHDVEALRERFEGYCNEIRRQDAAQDAAERFLP